MNTANNKSNGNAKNSELTEPDKARLDKTGRASVVEDAVDQDAAFEQALRDFKSSVHGWSDAVYHRPRTVGQPIGRRSWRPALGWAMGCLLVAGSVSGGLLERQHRVEQAQRAALQNAADQQKLLNAQQASKENEEDLLAQVDADVSRQVPSALEPLTEIVGEDEAQ